MKWKLRKPITMIVGAIMALTTMNAATAANTDNPIQSSYNIVALGDSITVGYEPTMIEEDAPAPYGYVERIYEQALYRGHTELDNYAIMGLTTKGLSNLLQGASEGRKLSASDIQDFSTYDPRILPQVESVVQQTAEISPSLAKADLVILTIGGNDFGSFINKVMKLPIDEARKVVKEEYDSIMNKYTTEVELVVRQLHELSPQAQIVFSDQYLPLWPAHKLYPDLLIAADTLTAKLDDLVSKLSQEGVHVKLAPISSKFQSKESLYTYANLLDYDNHPKQAGYEVIAEQFTALVWDQYLKTTPRAKDVPISVVINGKELVSKPILKESRTFLGMRDFSKAVNAELEWIPSTKTAIFRKNGNVVSITIDAKTIVVNGVKQSLEAPAFIQNSLTYVPLSVISQGLSYQVTYRGGIKTAFINP